MPVPVLTPVAVPAPVPLTVAGTYGAATFGVAVFGVDTFGGIWRDPGIILLGTYAKVAPVPLT